MIRIFIQMQAGFPYAYKLQAQKKRPVHPATGWPSLFLPSNYAFLCIRSLEPHRQNNRIAPLGSGANRTLVLGYDGLGHGKADAEPAAAGPGVVPPVKPVEDAAYVQASGLDIGVFHPQGGMFPPRRYSWTVPPGSQYFTPLSKRMARSSPIARRSPT